MFHIFVRGIWNIWNMIIQNPVYSVYRIPSPIIYLSFPLQYSNTKIQK